MVHKSIVEIIVSQSVRVCVIIEIEHKRRYISPINVSFQMMTVSWPIQEKKEKKNKRKKIMLRHFFTAAAAAVITASVANDSRRTNVHKHSTANSNQSHWIAYI